MRLAHDSFNDNAPLRFAHVGFDRRDVSRKYSKVTVGVAFEFRIFRVYLDDVVADTLGLRIPEHPIAVALRLGAR